MADLLQWASRLSGLPSVPTLPELRTLPAADLAQRVCPERPEDCRTLDLRDGDQLFAGCTQVMAAETVAYNVQNRYL